MKLPDGIETPLMMACQTPLQAPRIASGERSITGAKQLDLRRILGLPAPPIRRFRLASGGPLTAYSGRRRQLEQDFQEGPEKACRLDRLAMRGGFAAMVDGGNVIG
jgi:hypothetical protein